MEIAHMDKQRRECSSASRGGSLIERDNDSNTRNTANKALSFSIEAILSAPHPKRQPTAVKRRQLSRSGASDSPLLTLADFASNVLPTEKDKELGSNENVSRSMQQKLAAFQARLNARKRRKARTCFTNQQIFELERRFMYQKYLSPADRDEIAQTLCISGAQVITWFQNRRAKFRRDLEELKSDVQAAKIMDTKQVNRLYKRLEI